MRTLDSAGQVAAEDLGEHRQRRRGDRRRREDRTATTFKYHYQMHAPDRPERRRRGRERRPAAIIYSHVKDGYGTSRPKIAAVLGYPLNNVRIVYYEGASSFGGGAIHVDTGEAAAIMSQAVGKPVRLQYMRWDEHGWDNYGQAMMFDVQGRRRRERQHRRARLPRASRWPPTRSRRPSR